LSSFSFRANLYYFIIIQVKFINFEILQWNHFKNSLLW